MSDNDEKEQDFDENALAGLVRPSAVHPPRGEQEDDGKLDLRALVASSPGVLAAPAPPAETTSLLEPAKKAPQSGLPSEERPTTPREVEASGATRSEGIARASGGGTVGLWAGLGIAVVACVGAYLYVASHGAAGEAALARNTETVAQNEPVGTRGSLGSEEGTRADEPRRSEAFARAEPSPERRSSPTASEEEPGAGEPTPATGPTDAPSSSSSAGAREARQAQNDLGPAGRDPDRGGEERRRERGERPESTQSASSPSSGGSEAPAGSRTGPPARGGTERNPSAPAGSASSSTERGSAPPAGASAEGLDRVLDQALGGRPDRSGTRTTPVTSASGSAASAPTTSRSSTPSASGELPETPSQADVRRVLGQLMPQIRACAGEQVGLAVATILVRNDGTVASVAIGGSPFAGTPQGACMEGALRRATFPPFRASSFRIQYPISIRPGP